jgi:hypothetical protein
MKQRTSRRAALIALPAGLLLIVAGLWLTLRPRGGERGARGEHLPQATESPGMHAAVKLWGMPNRELYTPLDAPEYVGPEEAQSFLEEGDRVYLIQRGGATYVFPEVLLTSFHVVNAVIAGEPLAVTFCLLAGSASAFSRRIEERVLSFGLTGQLYCGNSVLYDRETGTDWLQLNGEPLRGPYHGRARLQAKTLEYSTWERIQHRRDLRVLAPIRRIEEYRRFQREMEAEHLGQKVVESERPLDPRLLPYTKGLGIRVQGESCFYPLDPHGSRSLYQDTAGGWSILLLRGSPGESSRILRRHHRGRVLEFDLIDGVLADRETASTWSDEGLCTDGPLAGERLETPFYTEVYWFVWAALYPETRLP